MRRIAAAALLFACSTPLWAAQCEQVIESNDAMQFNVKDVTVDKSCKTFTVTLKHTGKLPRNAMGHNWVLTKQSDMQGAATAGIAAGLNNEYVKQGDERVLAHTKVIGGGETATVTFDVAKLKAGETYAYFCSFPGHWAIMKGTLKLGS
ncbi:Azurin [plant metagenome]|uniref:Azurin n=1 Tax=plant metagenome TaxID=1297885 RepID=A0A484QJK8_9ZZZZ